MAETPKFYADVHIAKEAIWQLQQKGGSIVIPINRIERKRDSQKYRIVGKGVTVEFLAQFINDPDWPVSRICENYGLTPGEVFAAWAFYSDHREEIDRVIAEGEALLEDYPPDNEKRRKLQKS